MRKSRTKIQRLFGGFIPTCTCICLIATGVMAGDVDATNDLVKLVGVDDPTKWNEATELYSKIADPKLVASQAMVLIEIRMGRFKEAGTLLSAQTKELGSLPVPLKLGHEKLMLWLLLEVESPKAEPQLKRLVSTVVDTDLPDEDRKDACKYLGGVLRMLRIAGDSTCVSSETIDSEIARFESIKSKSAAKLFGQGLEATDQWKSDLIAQSREFASVPTRHAQDACRAGSTTAYCFGDDVESHEEYAWFRANSGLETHIVGAKKPNRWGLYDMHGNVSEWCQDYWAKEFLSRDEIDPMGPEDGPLRVLRGGCWGDVARFCRTAFHNGGRGFVRLQRFGFRVAMNQTSIQMAAKSAKSSVVGLSTPAHGQQLKEITNSIGMKLVLIHAGSFTMGSPIEEVGRSFGPFILDESQHEVIICKSYFLGAYEVTQGEYEKMVGNNPSRDWNAKKPVETVSWDDAVSFCKKLSELPEEKAAGREYRLPTEAEWEYACRAGSKSPHSFDNMSQSLEDYAWFGEDRDEKSHSVGLKKPNRWGFFDMHGNVWEWCQDWHETYPSDAVTDPQGPMRGSSRVLRGGAWCNEAGYCRSASRNGAIPSGRHYLCGLRVALSLPTYQPASTQSK